MQNPATLPPAAGKAFRLAHVSDPHLSTLAGADWRDFLNKRVLGYLSWRIRRRHEHRPEVLERLREDLAAAAPAQVLITGDLTHVGLPSECREADTWLRALGTPETVSLVPGNHDRYVDAPWLETAGLWQRHMRGDGTGADTASFPWLRRRGPVALIGLSTAVPTPPFFATGQLGHEQLDACADLLDTARGEGLFRIVLLHHPPVDSVTGFRRRLVDAAAFRNVIDGHGAELVLHGHAHRWVRTEVATRHGAVPVIGIPSASALTTHAATRAGYNLIDVLQRAGGWDVRITGRRLAGDARGFETHGQESLTATAA